MSKDSLIKTNPYLKNPITRDAMLRRTVVTSTAIEGVHIAEKDLKPAKKRKKKIAKTD